MKNILVAEDETAIREFVVINLERAGYNVTEAENGAIAVEKYDASNGYLFSQSIAVDAVEYSDALVEQLKKKV